jgi:hypothetical protein
MKIDLPIYSKIDRAFVVVKAEIVDVAPHLPSATFAVHKCPWRDEMQTWKVSNIETGSYVNGGSIDWYEARSKAAVIEAARKRLAEFTDEQLRKAMVKAERKHSPSKR